MEWGRGPEVGGGRGVLLGESCENPVLCPLLGIQAAPARKEAGTTGPSSEMSAHRFESCSVPRRRGLQVNPVTSLCLVSMICRSRVIIIPALLAHGDGG